MEELGAWKAGLLRWTAEAAEAISVLLDEHTLVRSHARRAYKLLSELVAAFDPLHAESSSHSLSIGGDGVSASLAAVDQAQALHQRLLGPLLTPPDVSRVQPLQEDTGTPGEKMASQVSGI